MATCLPPSNEIILPVIQDAPGIAILTSQIVLSDLVDIIKSEVTNGAVIEMEVTDVGIKFIKS